MNVIVIDDDIFVTMSLKTILEAGNRIQVIASGNDGEDAVRLYKQLQPDVLLMDIRMKQKSGLQAAREILADDPNAKILLLTTFMDDEYIVQAIQLGAKGYLLKQDVANIAPAIEAVYQGQTVFGGEVIQKLPELLSAPNKSPDKEEACRKYGLSPKELEIIQHIADGKNNKEIAADLFFSEGTIRNYISSILEKLELRDRTQIACFYYKFII